MSIRSQLRRALRKSDGSADSSATVSPNASPNTSQSSEGSLNKTTSMFSRALTWNSSRDKVTEIKKEKKTNKKKRPVHPSEKPLTAQNMRHQEMLSHFTLTFGASDPSQICRLSFDGISPCCTRRPSLEGDAFTSGSSRQDYFTTDDEDGMVPP